MGCSSSKPEVVTTAKPSSVPTPTTSKPAEDKIQKTEVKQEVSANTTESIGRMTMVGRTDDVTAAEDNLAIKKAEDISAQPQTEETTKISVTIEEPQSLPSTNIDVPAVVQESSSDAAVVVVEEVTEKNMITTLNEQPPTLIESENPPAVVPILDRLSIDSNEEILEVPPNSVAENNSPKAHDTRVSMMPTDTTTDIPPVTDYSHFSAITPDILIPIVSSAEKEKPVVETSKASADAPVTSTFAVASKVQEPPVKRGFAKKQGQLVKTWKHRYFVLEKGILTYFADLLSDSPPYPVHKKGEVSLIGMKVLFFEDMILLTSDGKTDRDLLIKVTDQEERKGWISSLLNHIKFANGEIEVKSSATSNAEPSEHKVEIITTKGKSPPAIKQGLITKQGQFFKSWKKRHFVLNEGNLAYYESASEAAPYGIGKKGEVSLDGMEIVQNGASVMLTSKGAKDRDLSLLFSDVQESKEWSEAFQQHIDFLKV
eukprot:gene6789-9299_t